MDSQDIAAMIWEWVRGNVELLIAVYAAILATFHYLTDRRKESRSIKVFLDFVSFYERYRTSAVNTGHRPVTLVDGGYRLYLRGWLKNLSLIRRQGKIRITWGLINKIVGDGFRLLVDEVALDMVCETVPLPATLADGESLVLQLTEAVVGRLISKDYYGEIYFRDAEGNEYKSKGQRRYNPRLGVYSDSPEH